MPVKFFCNECGKEILQKLDIAIKRRETVYDIEQACMCSDCSIKVYQSGTKGGEKVVRVCPLESGADELHSDESSQKS